jgi:L-asparaginase II
MVALDHFVPFACMERGGIAESYHFGVAALADAKGGLQGVWGDADFVTFPRSALKPFQAIDLIENGAFDALGLGEKHLALACASHRGEPFHAELVREWLGRLHCDEGCLLCGPALPGDWQAMKAYLRAGLAPSSVLYNCSGKHCGFLTSASHLGLPAGTYDSPDHPLQRRYREVLSRYLGRTADTLNWSRDDCTLPAPAMSMRETAIAIARFAQEASEAADAPAARILKAMGNHPLLVAGTGELSQRLNEVVGNRAIAKTGAEGYLVIFFPAGGLGLALKVADGGRRGRDIALIAILRQAGLIDAVEEAALMSSLAPPHLDSQQRAVGHLHPILPPSAAQ